jgi:F-type H+-transporting ATPase subunit b
MLELLLEPEVWVTIAFIIFLAILVRLGVPAMITKTLDARTARIKTELEQASRLRKEAEAVLAQYQRKRAEVQIEAAAIIDNARRDAERMAAEAAAKAEEFITRRTRMAETRIAQAEAQAVSELRSAAADAAVAAAERILADTTHGRAAEALIEDGIREIKAKLN